MPDPLHALEEVLRSRELDELTSVVGRRAAELAQVRAPEPGDDEAAPSPRVGLQPGKRGGVSRSDDLLDRSVDRLAQQLPQEAHALAVTDVVGHLQRIFAPAKDGGEAGGPVPAQDDLRLRSDPPDRVAHLQHLHDVHEREVDAYEVVALPELFLEVLDVRVLQDDAGGGDVLGEEVERDVMKMGPQREDVLVPGQPVASEIEVDVLVGTDDAGEKNLGHCDSPG